MHPIPRLASAVSIVVVGDFRRTDVTPGRLRDLGLLSDTDVLSVKYNILLPGEIVSFEAGWLSVEAKRDRLQVATSNDADFERVRDVLIGILRSATDLECSKLGINRSVHLELGSFKAFDAVGPTFANLAEWEKGLRAPALKGLTVLGYRENQYGGRLQVQMEPSVHFPLAVFVTVNDHYDLCFIDQPPRSRQEAYELRSTIDDPDQNAEKCDVAKKILSEEWEHSMQRADVLIDIVAGSASL